MRRAFLLCLALFVPLVVGCSSDGSSSCDAACHRRLVGSESSAGRASVVRADPCAIFNHFYEDLMRLTPRGSQITLNNDLDGIISAALDSGNDKLYRDASDLVAHVASSSWPENGTPADSEITAVQDDCA